MRVRRAFTLVEVLVVIGIIAILVGILLPVVSRARASANRVACAAQLRDLGNVFQMYLTANKGRLPALNPFPAVAGFHAGASLWDAFEPQTKLGLNASNYLSSRGNVWRCPADRLIANDVQLLANSWAETYYDAYGVSYEYNYWMNDNYGFATARDGKMQPPNSQFRQALVDARNGRFRSIPADQFRIFNDLTYYHGRKGVAGNMNFLFADWHVSDLDGQSSGKTVIAGGA